MKSLNVLSLCDGMSCGHIALLTAQNRVRNYWTNIKGVTLSLERRKSQASRCF